MANAIVPPAAFVSLVIAPAVAVPEDEAPNAGVAKVNVATAVDGVPSDDPVMRNTNLLPAPSSRSTTPFVAASCAAVLPCCE